MEVSDIIVSLRFFGGGHTEWGPAYSTSVITTTLTPIEGFGDLAVGCCTFLLKRFPFTMDPLEKEVRIVSLHIRVLT